MPLKVLKGPVNSGKTAWLTGALLRTFKDHSGMFIVPDEHIAAEIRTRLISDKTSAIIGDCVVTLPRFIEKTAAVSKAVIAVTQAALLVQKIFQSHKLKYFKSAEFFPSIARQFAATILALKKNGIDAKRLRTLLETRGSLKENDLLRVFELYESELKKLVLLDEGDLNSLAKENIKRGEVSKLSSVSTIIFDEFDSFTPGEIEIIKAMKSGLKSAQIIVSCPVAKTGDELFSQYLARSAKEIEQIADEVVTFRENKERDALVSVFVTRSPLAEARAIAGAVLDEISNGKVRGENVQVVMRPEGTFLKLFLEELKFLGLGANISSPMSSPVVHGIFPSPVIELWPEKASVEEYAKLLSSHIRENWPVTAWEKDLKELHTERPWASRTFLAAVKISDALEKLSVFARYIGAFQMKRETFIRLVMDEVFTEPKPWGLLNRELDFRLTPPSSGTSTHADVVIIPQMAEGTIPHIAPERMFFSEADTLSPAPDAVIVRIFPNIEDSLAIEAFRFEKFIRKCRKKIILTYSAINSSGKEASPSTFLFPFPKAVPCDPRPPVPSAARSRNFEERLSFAIKIEKERTTGEIENQNHHGILKDKNALLTVSSRYTKNTLSPTGLERYAECPFVFFAEKVLGLKPREEETPDINPKDRGTIVHAILEKFYAAHSKEFGFAAKGKLDEAALFSLLDGVIEDVFREHKEILSRTAEGLRPFERAAIKTMALQVIALETAQAKKLPSPLFPKLHEWGFGTEPANTLKIPVENEPPALISGRIDRIDTDAKEKTFLVVDYKTGADVSSVKSDIMKGLHLQLPLYVEAVKQFLFPSALALGGLLIGVRSAEKKHGFVRKEFDGVSYDVGKAHSKMQDDEWDESVAAALSAAANYTKEIRSGNFRAKPGKECIRHCEYEDVCRYFAKGSH